MAHLRKSPPKRSAAGKRLIRAMREVQALEIPRRPPGTPVVAHPRRVGKNPRAS